MGKKSDTKETKGCVGYVKEGIIKNGRLIVVYSTSDDPKNLYDEYSETHGRDIKIRYCLCNNVKSAYKEFKESIDPSHHIGNIYCSTSASVDGRLREAADEKVVHRMNLHTSNGRDRGWKTCKRKS